MGVFAWRSVAMRAGRLWRGVRYIRDRRKMSAVLGAIPGDLVSSLP